MIEQFVSTYGYIAVLLGVFVEGETFLILASIAAQQGHLVLPLVMLVAFVAAVIWDNTFFFLGRWRSEAVLSRWPALRPRIAKTRERLRRYRIPLILVYRFVYGMRTIVPLASGMSRMDPRLFVPLQVLTAALWSVAVCLVGYFLGGAAEALLSDVRHWQIVVLLGVAVIGLVVWLLSRWRRKRPERR